MEYERCFSYLSGRKKNKVHVPGRENLLKKAFQFRFVFWSCQALFNYVYHSISGSHRNHINETETRLDIQEPQEAAYFGGDCLIPTGQVK